MLKVPKQKHRVHSLTGRISSCSLRKAFKAVKKNRGAAGIDRQTIEMFEANLEENIEALKRELKTGTYLPIALRRAYVPKDAPGKFRPLGIPAVRCRVAQEIVRYLINPIFERTFHDSSHGFRQNRSCHTAMKQLLEYHGQGYRLVVDADIHSFYDTINQRLVLGMVEREVADGNILGLIKKFLQAGVMEDGRIKPTSKGTPQGGVISPLLSNIVLNHLDWTLEQHGYKFVRYADDFVVLCKTKAQAEKALEVVRRCLEEDLGLQLSPEKTKITTFSRGFIFLGYRISSRTIRMSPKAEEKFKNKIRKVTRRSHNLDAEVVEKVNRVVRGTVNYFCTSFTTNLGQFNYLDRWIRKRIRCMKYKRIWYTDNQRMLNRYIWNMGFLSCREHWLHRAKVVKATPLLC